MPPHGQRGIIIKIKTRIAVEHRHQVTFIKHVVYSRRRDHSEQACETYAESRDRARTTGELLTLDTLMVK